MILAADLGSTNFKAALFAEDGRRVADVSRPVPYHIHTNRRAELSPPAITECFAALIAAAAERAGTVPAEIRRISITSQAQTFCVCDGEGGAVSPFYGWTDARAADESAELQGLPRFHATTGFSGPSPLLTLSKVLWWNRHHGLPEDHRVVQLPSFLAMRLGAAHATDSNLAAMSGFYSIPEGAWWTAALDACGLKPGQLGRVVSPGEVLPRACAPEISGLRDDLEVVMAGNDHTAGAVGVACAPGRPVLTLGTAGVLYRRAGKDPGPYSAEGLWGPYPGNGYYELLCLDHACSALDWADEFLFGAVDSQRFVEKAKRAEARLDAPFFDPRGWGGAGAWSGEGTEAEKARAVLEGIAFALRDLAGGSFCAPGEEIVILGGGSRLDFWVRLLAGIFQRPFVRGAGDGLDGAAILAGLDVQGVTADSEIFPPDPSARALLDERFRGWCEWRRQK